MPKQISSAPLLSIVVPAYQAQVSIERLLASILAWDGDDIEVVVVNDGSTDATQRLCSDAAAKDVRIRLVNRENGGRSSARNEGISVARGEWLMFADSDDCFIYGWAPTVRRALGLGYELVVFAMVRSDGLDSFGRPPSRPRTGSPVEMSASAVLKGLMDGTFRTMLDAAGSFEWNACWGRLYRRSIIDRVVDETGGEPFPVGLRFSEDRLFNLCCLKVMGAADVRFDYSPIYYWDLGLSLTVARPAFEDANTLIPYKKALNALAGVFESEELNQIMAMELASQFRRSSSLPVRELASASMVWKEVLASGVPNNCWPYIPGFLGKRRRVYAISVALLRMGYSRAALSCQGLIQGVGAMAGHLREKLPILQSPDNVKHDI